MFSSLLQWCFYDYRINRLYLSVATSLSNLSSTEAKSSFCCLDDALEEKAAVCDLF